VSSLCSFSAILNVSRRSVDIDNDTHVDDQRLDVAQESPDPKGPPDLEAMPATRGGGNVGKAIQSTEASGALDRKLGEPTRFLGPLPVGLRGLKRRVSARELGGDDTSLRGSPPFGSRPHASLDSNPGQKT